MTRLIELNPRWIQQNVFTFLCPHCRETWLTCTITKMPRDEQMDLIDKEFGEDKSHLVVHCSPSADWALKDGNRDFTTMTVTPSLDASASGHWHGFITNGDIT